MHITINFLNLESLSLLTMLCLNGTSELRFTTWEVVNTNLDTWSSENFFSSQGCEYTVVGGGCGGAHMDSSPEHSKHI